MAKILAMLTPQEYEKLCGFDYGDLYSAHRGTIYTHFSPSLEIFVGVNRYGRLFINVNFYPEGHKTFNFDCLSDAIKWAKKRVRVVSPLDDDVPLISMEGYK